MPKIFKDIEEWLYQRPKWLQDAAVRLISNEIITEKDIEVLVELCKTEVGLSVGEKTFNTINPGSLSSKDDAQDLSLESIDNISGISALAPKNP